MSEQFSKTAAVFSDPHVLKAVVDDLVQSGFEHISVMVKSNTAQEIPEHIRTYSTATYPSTTRIPPTVDLGASNRVQEDMIEGMALDNDLEVPDWQKRDTISEAQVVRDADVRDLKEEFKTRKEVSSKDPDALVKGTVIGGVVGALAGAVALMIPGVGPVLAAGTLATTLGAVAGGTAAGLTIGAIVGVLQDVGFPQERMQAYREAFESGKAIVLIEPHGEDKGTKVARAQGVLRRYHPEMLDMF